MWGGRGTGPGPQGTLGWLERGAGLLLPGNLEMKCLRNLAQGFHKPELLPLSNYSLELGLRRGWGTASGHHCPSCPLPGTCGNLRTTNTGGAPQPRAGQAAPLPSFRYRPAPYQMCPCSLVLPGTLRRPPETQGRPRPSLVTGDQGTPRAVSEREALGRTSGPSLLMGPRT